MPDKQSKQERQTAADVPPNVAEGAPVIAKLKTARKPVYANPVIIAALIAVSGPPLTLWVQSVTSDPPTVLYQFTVHDKTGAPIRDAKLTLVLDPARKVSEKVSDLNDNTKADGAVFFPFRLPKSFVNKYGWIEVEATGYETRKLLIQLALTLPPQSVLLTPVPTNVSPTVPPPPIPVKLDPYTRTKTLGPVPSGRGSGKL